MRFNWGHGIAAVYTLFATATLWFVVFAIGHPAELVSADYYQRALDHDRRTDAASRATALGDRFSVHVSPEGAVMIQLADARTATGLARLYRPSSEGQDREWPLAIDGTGRQTFPTAGLAPGRWLLQVDWQTQGLEFYAERPVTLP